MAVFHRIILLLFATYAVLSVTAAPVQVRQRFSYLFSDVESELS